VAATRCEIGSRRAIALNHASTSPSGWVLSDVARKSSRQMTLIRKATRGRNIFQRSVASQQQRLRLFHAVREHQRCGGNPVDCLNARAK
jgi:hypothetical protein